MEDELLEQSQAPASFDAIPLQAAMLREQGKTYRSKGLLDQAAGVFFQALALYPSSIETRQILADTLTILGQSLFKHGQLIESEIAIRTALMLYPEWSNAQDALAHFTSYQSPISYVDLYNEAVAHIQNARYVEAELSLRTAIMQNPNIPQIADTLTMAIYQQALPLHRTKRLIEAEAKMWECLLLRPDFPEAVQFLHVSSRHPSRVVPVLPDQGLADPVRAILKMLRIKDAINCSQIRVGQPADGGYVMLDQGLDNVVAYSLGIGGDVSWDTQIANRGCQIFQYDHTIEKLPQEHQNFHWFKTGVAGSPTSDPRFKTISELIEKNGHNGRDDLLLKTDIEGAEWDMLAELDDSILQQFSQIVGEFHDFSGIANPEVREKILKGLQKLTKHHQVVHVHGNSAGTIAIIGGIALPDLLEITLIRKADHTFKSTTKTFPSPLDAANIAEQAEYGMDLLGFTN